MLHLFSGSEFIQDKACWQILAVFPTLQSRQADPWWCQAHAQLSRGLGEGGRGLLWTGPAWCHLHFWLQPCAFSCTLHLSWPGFVEISPWAANTPLLADGEVAVPAQKQHLGLKPSIAPHLYLCIVYWTVDLPARIHPLLPPSHGLKWVIEHRKQ